MPKNIKFCDYCSGILIKGDEVFHAVYCEKSVLESKYYNKYLNMNYHCIDYLKKYIYENGIIQTVKNLFLLLIKERLNDQGLKVEFPQKKDLLLFLNESKPYLLISQILF